MSTLFSKEVSGRFAAPILGAILLVSASAVSGAQAAPISGKSMNGLSHAELIVNVDHRGRPGRGWHRGPGRHHHALGPKQIRRSLRHRGFHRIRILDRRGPMYIVKARGWQGYPVRLVVDSRDGHIVRSRPMGPRFHWSYHW